MGCSDYQERYNYEIYWYIYQSMYNYKNRDTHSDYARYVVINLHVYIIMYKHTYVWSSNNYAHNVSNDIYSPTNHESRDESTTTLNNVCMVGRSATLTRKSASYYIRTLGLTWPWRCACRTVAARLFDFAGVLYTRNQASLEESL